jgi:ornithine carbamoyltransferase
MNHFLNLKDFDTTYINLILDRAIQIKKDPSKFKSILKDKRMYMLFQKTSTRTALSFGLGMVELGGVYFHQNWIDSNFAIGEIQDEVRYVGKNVDVIVARLRHNEDINLMAKYSSVPVINGCCNKFHPCQAMADLLTIKEVFGSFNVKLLYIGVRNNVLNSLMESLPRVGGEILTLTPIVNKPSIDQGVNDIAKATGRHTNIDPGISSEELRKIVQTVDIIYVDSWVDMEFFNDKAYENEKTDRIDKMMPFQVNAELLEGSKAIVMHDMPIHTGYEITREIAEKNIDVILQQAENRRHAQNAILATLLEDDSVKKYFA